MISTSKRIELAQWLIDPSSAKASAAVKTMADKSEGKPDNLEFLESQLEKLGLFNIYKNIELPLVEILDSMHKVGIKVDLDYLAKLSKELDKEITALVKKIYKLADGKFNINSPKQLSEI